MPDFDELHTVLNSLKTGDVIVTTWANDDDWPPTTHIGPVRVDNTYVAQLGTQAPLRHGDRWLNDVVRDKLLSLTHTTTAEHTVTRDEGEEVLHALLDTLAEGRQVKAVWSGTVWVDTHESLVRIDGKRITQPASARSIRYPEGELCQYLHSITVIETVEQTWERDPA